MHAYENHTKCNQRQKCDNHTYEDVERQTNWIKVLDIFILFLSVKDASDNSRKFLIILLP